MSAIEIEIVGVKVAISQNTVDAFEGHAAFCSLGQAWLIRNDPEAYKEQELIELVKEALTVDFKVAISGLTEDEQDEFSDEFSDVREDDWWYDLGDAIEAMKRPKIKVRGRKRT
jgi:hypothetical protein